MKIYGNDSFFSEKNGIRNAAQMKAVQENRKITEFAGRLVDEARNLFDKVREEIAKLEAMNKNEIDFEGRMEAEAYNYRAETVERGRKQSQLDNYRKISQMTSDVAALWGNIRA